MLFPDAVAYSFCNKYYLLFHFFASVFNILYRKSSNPAIYEIECVEILAAIDTNARATLKDENNNFRNELRSRNVKYMKRK